MLSTPRIMQLYQNVLFHDMSHHGISDTEVQVGIECLQAVYLKGSASIISARSQIADYNNVAHRCAYLHKYAAFHTAMVRDMMYEAVQSNYRFFYDLIFSVPRFSICCLGAGPGTDVIGVLAALHNYFSYFDTSVTLLDYMENWSLSFRSILSELGTGLYGAFGNNAYHFLNWRYLGANLLRRFSPDVNDAISLASLVTMIKFASAASCIDTENMINNIFIAMKPGAILFFIDNDAGGYHELIMTAATKYRFTSIFGPIRHENYTNEAVKTKRFGYTSCFKSTITVHILQKPSEFLYPNNPRPDHNCSYRSPFLASPPTTVMYSPLTPYILQPPTDPFPANVDFVRDAPHSNSFRNSPILETPPLLELQSRIATPVTNNIVNSPYGSSANLRPSNFSPNVHWRSRRKQNNGCLPIRQWRNKLSRKISQVKAQSFKLLGRRRQQKRKNTHPIFRL